ncbi:sigma D regulator [Dasania sp. GY-MA-18]|uniref:Sigma D regulator n=1 Tax=Dasania phycosphaerae TaxID=2950436 RepID=A0A9J6RJK0_9GAMM|nr:MULTISPECIES: sigma D regulator [Dasania]MCR8922223.1 sigma D regulator [Dasania sp. GY-MA-18]MCZ0864651.1 sigma D regulator [Dasania phycosphaerae]MCZ0868379.1 sigma D regulator [Dasania phycosphaerae]
MLDTCTIEERWSGVNDMIERWLEERQKLIVEFCAAGEDHKSAEQLHKRLQNFCQLLVDYVCAGHFEVYYQLLREAEEFKDGSANIAQGLLPELNENTSIAMEFHDQYAETDPSTPLNDLSTKLSKLGETLELRFEIEDRLIDVMHNAHKAVVASEA